MLNPSDLPNATLVELRTRATAALPWAACARPISWSIQQAILEQLGMPHPRRRAKAQPEQSARSRNAAP